MTPVLILTHNCLELTKRCVESVRSQDVDTQIHVVDNGSMDDTPLFCFSQNDIHFSACGENKGVSYGWNRYIQYNFDKGFDHVLVINNDTELPSFFLRELLACNVPFVTGASSTDRDAVAQPPVRSLTDGPDFSAFLIRREAWEKVGPFDETMVHYCSDVDYDIRARAAGLTLHNCHVKFYHERSSTLRLSADRAAIEERSHLDHLAFKAKYGCFPNELGWVAQ